MVILYVVTHGDYSDYGISAIFSTEEAAREFIAGTKDGWDDTRIELYELDKPGRADDEGRQDEMWPIPVPYSVRLARDGSLVQTELRDLDERKAVDGVRFHQVHWSRQWVLDVECMAMSREHAIKIANEKLTQFIAEEKWDETKTKTCDRCGSAWCVHVFEGAEHSHG